jgi:cyanophycinase
LAGGGRWQAGETGLIDASILGWANLERPMAVLATAGGSTASSEGLLEHYVDLGGPSGYVVPIFQPSDARRLENRELLAQAGVVYLADGPDPLRLVRALRESPALEGMAEAFEGGAVVAAFGRAAMGLGAWVAASEALESVEPGLGWLPQVVVEPHFVGTESAKRLQALLAHYPGHLGMGLPDGVALALGPEGRVETLGDEQVTMVLAPG